MLCSRPVSVNYWYWLSSKVTGHHCAKLLSNFLFFFYSTVQAMCVILSAETGNWNPDFFLKFWNKDISQAAWGCLQKVTHCQILSWREYHINGNSTPSPPSSYTLRPTLFHSKEEWNSWGWKGKLHLFFLQFFYCKILCHQPFLWLLSFLFARIGLRDLQL